jgi:hypothetical protein
MNIGDKIFLLYTDKKTSDRTCDGPLEIVNFLDEPLNDEGTIVVERHDGKTSMVRLEGTASYDVEVHVIN